MYYAGRLVTTKVKHRKNIRMFFTFEKNLYLSDSHKFKKPIYYSLQKPSGMTDKEHQEYIKQLRAVTSKLLATKKASQAFYISAGIHDEKGNLNSMYTSEKATIGYTTEKRKK